MAVVIKSARDVSEKQQALHIALYGPERSGKTTFASTFPAPVILVPDLCKTEMSVLGDTDIPCIFYHTLGDALDACKMLEKEVKNGYKRTGGFLTVVVDNVTVAYQMWLDQLEKSPSNKPSFNVWGEIYRYNLAMYRILHGLPDTNIVWICHDKTRVVSETIAGKQVDTVLGQFSVQGKAFTEVIAKTCMLMHTEVIRTETKELYRVWLKKHGIWKAGGWFRESQKVARTLDYIGNPKHKQPHYDVLAKALGLASAEEQEDEFFKE